MKLPGLVYRHSGPQGAVKPLTIIDSPADWTSEGLKGQEATYTLRFSEADRAEIQQAVEKLKARGVASEDNIQQVCPA